MGGIPVIGVDVDFLSEAQKNPAGDKAQVVEQLKRDAANMHAGEKSFIILPLAYNEVGKPLFQFDLKGVDGGGKMYRTDDIIRRKQNEILMLYMADVLKLGGDGSGSFALSDNKMGLLTLAIERHLKFIVDTLMKDLVKQTLELNGFNLPEGQIPLLRYTNLDAVNADEFSKMIQRTASVGFLPRTPEIINEVLDKSGFDYRIDKGIPNDDFLKMFPTEMQSKSGEGMKTAGPGTAKSPVGGDASVSNKENA